jgi:aspartate carbamoyltransferase catalytic subunit
MHGVKTAVPRGAHVPVASVHKPATASWAGRDFLGLSGLTPAELREVLARTHHYSAVANDPSTCTGELHGRTVATMFFEDSTRTRTSFTLAARRLGADAIDLSSGASSVNKGESLVDTALTVEAMGVSAMVVRTRQGGGPGCIADAVRCPVLNAGDGRHEHPTQGLLDAYTIAAAHRRTSGFDFSGLTVAIVGDVANSRVARSAMAAMIPLGARIVCVGPPGLVPAGLRSLGAEVTQDLDAVLPDADVVMMLRIQFERHGDPSAKPDAARSPVIASAREYRELYAMTGARAERLKPGAIIMHPGPMNRGLEIDGDVASGPRSVVLRQVANGVAARMAVLSLFAAG